MIIDAHNHPDWYGYDLRRYLENMKKYDIDQTWLLSWETPKDEYDPSYYKSIPRASQNGPIPFERCLAYKEKVPEKFILGYAPDPRKPEAIDQLSAAIDMYGVQVCGEVKLRMMYDNPDALRLFRFCGEKKLPVVLHLDYEFSTGKQYPRPNWWYGGGIEVLERVLKSCPDTIFLGHAPGFWAHISGDDQYDKVERPNSKVLPGGKIIELLHAYPNLYCDLSAGSGYNALNRDHEFAKRFLIEFQDRILYARDYFDNIHQEILMSFELPKTVMEKIFYQNALNLLEG